MYTNKESNSTKLILELFYKNATYKIYNPNYRDNDLCKLHDALSTEQDLDFVSWYPKLLKF